MTSLNITDKPEFPSVTVVIPTFNQASYLPIAVASGLDQKNVFTTVLVSDDGSSDDTQAVMEQFKTNSRVQYHRHERNGGIAQNCQWVMRQPTTPFIVRLDSDDLLHPTYCQELLVGMNANPGVGVAHGAVTEIDQFGKPKRSRRLARKTGTQASDDALRNAAQGYRVAANICMFRREALESVDFVYRPGMNFCEDWDLYARLAAAGWDNYYSSHVLARYRVWTDAGGYRKGRKISEIKGIIRLFEETLGPEWQQRGWDVRELNHARLRFAKSHIAAVAQTSPRDADLGEVGSLFSKLAQQPESFFASELEDGRAKMGWPYSWLAATKGIVRDQVKSLLYR